MGLRVFYGRMLAGEKQGWKQVLKDDCDYERHFLSCAWVLAPYPGPPDQVQQRGQGGYNHYFSYRRIRLVCIPAKIVLPPRWYCPQIQSVGEAQMAFPRRYLIILHIRMQW